MKRINKLHIIGLALIAAACGNPQTSVNTEVAIPVSVEEIKPSSIEKLINTTGTVLAAKEVALTSQVSGEYHLKVNPKTGRKFALGDIVEKDQVVIEFTDAEYTNNIGIQTKKLNMDIAEQEFKKQESLYQKGGVTLREYKNSEVSSIESKSNYQNAEYQLAKMKVKAPFRGVITDLTFYTEGTKVATNAKMFSMMDYSTMMMDVNLPEKFISEVQVSQLVRVTNYALPGDTLQGEVSQLSPAISTETRTFKGVLNIQNPDLKLRPGMFTKADIVLDRKDSVIVISKDIILSSQRGKSVFVVDNGTAEEKRITLGYETQDKVEVASGLKANDRLVVKGFETLRNRAKVKIVK